MANIYRRRCFALAAVRGLLARLLGFLASQPVKRFSFFVLCRNHEIERMPSISLSERDIDAKLQSAGNATAHTAEPDENNRA